QLGLTYYFYPAGTTSLSVGFASSTDGGANWSSPTTLAGPMSLANLPNTTLGLMVGDYISTSIASDGKAYPAFAVAAAASACGTPTPAFCEAINSTAGLAITGGGIAIAASEQAVPGAVSDHVP